MKTLSILSIIFLPWIEAHLLEQLCDSTNATCYDEWQRLGDSKRRAASSPLETSGNPSVCFGQRTLLLTSDCVDGPWGQLNLIQRQVEQIFGPTVCMGFAKDSPGYDALKDFNFLLVEAGAQGWRDFEPWMNTGGRSALERLAREGHSVLLNGAGWGWPYYMDTLFGAQYIDTFIFNFEGSVVDPVLTDGLSSNSLLGNAFAHGSIKFPVGEFEPLIANEERSLLVRGLGDSGSGNVMIGSMSSTNFHSPAADASQLRSNIYQALCDQARLHPIAVCSESVVLPAAHGCASFVQAKDLNAGSFDPRGAKISLSIDLSGPVSVGETKRVILTVSNEAEQADACESTVTVVDKEPLQAQHIDCGSVGVVKACDKDEIIQVQAVQKENGCPVDVESSFDECYFCVGDESRHSRAGCLVEQNRPNVYAITNPSGPGTFIMFPTIAVDLNGDRVERQCTICVEGGQACRGGLRRRLETSPFQCDGSFPDEPFQCQ